MCVSGVGVCGCVSCCALPERRCRWLLDLAWLDGRPADEMRKMFVLIGWMLDGMNSWVVGKWIDGRNLLLAARPNNVQRSQPTLSVQYGSLGSAASCLTLMFGKGIYSD